MFIACVELMVVVTVGKTFSLRCKIRAMVSYSFAFGETKKCRQHALLVLRLIKIICNRTSHEIGGRTDLTTLKLLLATETRANLTF